MGALALAGMVSGAGQGLERGLQQTQAGLIQYGLQDADRQFQSEKLKLQMEHAERLQQASIGAAASENAKNRELQSTLHRQTEEGANARNQQQIGGHLTGSAIQAEGTKAAAQLKEASDKDIAKLRIDADKEIHRANNQVQREGQNASIKVATMSSTQKLIDTLSDEATRISVALNKIDADPNSAAYKAAEKKLEGIQREKDAYVRRLADLSGTPLPAQTERKFVIPNLGGSTAPSTPPTAPSPAPGEQSAVPSSSSLMTVKPEDTWKRAGALVPGVTGLANMLRK